MHISNETKRLYRDISAGGAYAGLQHAGGYKKAIISFWEWHYWPDGYSSDVEETNLVAECVYPTGGVFGGEGEGSNCIKGYAWKQSHWYRMILHTWNDPYRATTMCGQWIQDVETGKYTLIAYFDTKMLNSYLTGDMMFFMENFYGINADEERDVRLRNVYYKPHGEDGWVSVNSFRLRHCNNWANNKTGGHSFGGTEEYVWGKAGGYVAPEDQEALDKSQPSQVYTIKQPDQPTIGDVAFRELRLLNRDEQQYIKWFMEDESTPQLSYHVKCTDVNGKVIYDRTEWAPEDFYHILQGVNTNAYLCELTVTDLFGNTKTAVNATKAYLEVHPDAEITHPSLKAEEETEDDDILIGDENTEDLSQNNKKDEKESDYTVVGIVAGIGGALAVAISYTSAMARKKKKKRANNGK
jgi:hypothetical protein